jgi:hypothetical protein
MEGVPMYTAETRVTTDRATRYLAQLCEHLSAIGQSGPSQADRHIGPGNAPTVECTTDHGLVRIGDAQFTMDATPDALALRAEAPDQAELERVKRMLTQRIQSIGRRDNLSVHW